MISRCIFTYDSYENGRCCPSICFCTANLPLQIIMMLDWTKNTMISNLVSTRPSSGMFIVNRLDSQII